MNNDVRKVIYGTIIGFFVMLAIWFSIIYISSCGFTFTCRQAARKVERTPIPTLIPAVHSEIGMEMGMVEFDKCQVSAMDLIGAWVDAGAPETEFFAFVDVNGQSCSGTYTDDVQPLFVENSIWRVGEIGCVSCHNLASDDSNGGLDMVSYAAISKSGILGNGNWKQSSLYKTLNQGLVAEGHSADTPPSNPIVFAGTGAPDAGTTVAP